MSEMIKIKISCERSMQEDNNASWHRFGVRAASFRAALDYVDAALRRRQGPPPVILETGTTRVDGAYSDGQSTVLFDAFAAQRGGRVLSVDLSIENCRVSRRLTSSDTTDVVCADSVGFLSRLARGVVARVDLLYLDSFDVDWTNPHASALHHLFELAAVFSHLKEGCVILVDDNAGGRGKGAYISQFMQAVGCVVLIDAYQIAFVKTRY